MRILGDNEVGGFSMLNQIHNRAASSGPQTAASLLLGCHDRIRHFTGVAVNLAHAHAAEPGQISRAADAVYRYFSISLPLHEADENLSLHPRLHRALGTAAPDEHSTLRQLAGPAADAMLEQHESIDQLVERMLPLLTILHNNPAALPDVANELCEITSALKQMFDGHLKLEEETVFPAMEKYLSPEELAELVAEMQARRRN